MDRINTEAVRVGFVTASELRSDYTVHHDSCPQWNATGDRTCNCLPSIHVVRRRDGAMLIVRDTPRPGRPWGCPSCGSNENGFWIDPSTGEMVCEPCHAMLLGVQTVSEVLNG